MAGADFVPSTARERERVTRASAPASDRSAMRLDLEHPPVITRAVDYGAGANASWWPRGEAPILADLVHEGRLQPVVARTGPEPVVMEGVDGIGTYGGTWLRLVNSIADIST